MAAFTGTPVKSTEKTAQTDGTRLDVVENSAVKLAHFSYTHAAGAGTGEIDLITLPAGKIKIYPDLCRIVSSAMAVGADLHLGYRAYTQEDGTAVVEDDNAFADNLDAGGGALDQAWVLPAAGVVEYNTKDGLEIYAMIDTGNIEDTDTIEGWVAYVK